MKKVNEFLTAPTKKKSRSTLESAGHIAALAAKQAESGMGLLKRTFVRNDANKYGSSNLDNLLRGGGYSQPSEKAKANEPKRIANQAKKKLNGR